jgi:hypothetical protein
VNVQAVNAETLEKVRLFVQQTLNAPVRSAQAPGRVGEDILALGRSCIALMTTNDVCFVALVNPTARVKDPCVIVPDQCWAAVNVDAMKAGNASATVVLDRTERQVMRCIGFLFGVGFTPDPRAVNHPITAVEQLDQIGKGFDPPGIEKFWAEAQQRGMQSLVFKRKKWLVKHGFLKDTPAQENKPQGKKPAEK